MCGGDACKSSLTVLAIIKYGGERIDLNSAGAADQKRTGTTTRGGGHVANGIDRESIRCVECSIGRIGRKGTRPDEIVVPYRRIESPSQQPSPSCVLP